MVYSVQSDHTLCLVIVISTRIEISSELGEITARDLNPYAVAWCKEVGGRHGAYCKLIDLALFHENLFVVTFAVAGTLDRLMQVKGSPVGIDVDELDGEICILDI